MACLFVNVGKKKQKKYIGPDDLNLFGNSQLYKKLSKQYLNGEYWETF